MGEVYRARDTQLGRDVAVKMLPSSYSGDAERLHRFEQEACAASALNHPNILSIYDVGTHEARLLLRVQLSPRCVPRRHAGINSATEMAAAIVNACFILVVIAPPSCTPTGLVRMQQKPPLTESMWGRFHLLD